MGEIAVSIYEDLSDMLNMDNPRMPSHIVDAMLEVWTFLRESFTEGVIWHGHMLMQTPTDMIAYAEAIEASGAQQVIETGTGSGGTSLWLADCLDVLWGDREKRVVTVDIRDGISVTHPDIHFIQGDSVSDETVERIRECINPNLTTLVTLDSDHGVAHVGRELELYEAFVSIGSYLIVQDTCLGMVVDNPTYELGPMGAVIEFVKSYPGFHVDVHKHRWTMGQSPYGFLKRTY